MSETACVDWVVVDSFIDVIHADIVRGRLEAEGVPAILGNRHLATAEWMWSQAMGGVQILVPLEHIAEAREIIAEIDAGKFARISKELAEDEICKTCGTSLVRKTSSSWKLALLVSHFVWLPFPFRKNIFYCTQCNG